MDITNQKAQGIGVNTIIVVALALLVLLLVGVFFTGGFGSLTDKLRKFTTGSTGEPKKLGDSAACNQICTAWAAEGCKQGTASYDKARSQCNATDYNALKQTCTCDPWL